MYWSYSFDYDWLISPDSEWLKSPDANTIYKKNSFIYKLYSLSDNCIFNDLSYSIPVLGGTYGVFPPPPGLLSLVILKAAEQDMPPANSAEIL